MFNTNSLSNLSLQSNGNGTETLNNKTDASTEKYLKESFETASDKEFISGSSIPESLIQNKSNELQKTENLNVNSYVSLSNSQNASTISQAKDQSTNHPSTNSQDSNYSGEIKRRIDAREYRHLLKSSDAGKNKFICVVCGKNDFYINPDDGYCKCYSGGCSHAEIRDAILALEQKSVSQSVGSLGRIENHKPAECKHIGKKTFGSKGKEEAWTEVKQTTYKYSNNQRILRYDGLEPYGKKDKRILHAHIDEKGSLVYRSSGEAYFPYGMHYWQDSKGKWVLFVEGEKGAEIALSLGIAATTIRIKKQEMELAFEKAAEYGVHLAYLRDWDETGKDNEKMFLEVAREHPNVRAVALNPEDLFSSIGSEAEQKDDIEQLVERGRQKGLSDDDLCEHLNQAIIKASVAASTSTSKVVKKDNLKEDEEESKEVRKIDLLEKILREKGAKYWINGRNPKQSSPETVILNSLYEGGEGDYRCLNSSIYQYSGRGYWKTIPDRDVHTDITHELSKLYEIKEDKGIPYAVHTAARDRIASDCFRYVKKYLNVKNYDAHNNYIVFNNCTLDLRTGEQLEHSREHLSTHYIEADYHPNQRCPEIFKNFIADSYGEEYLDIVRAYIASILDNSVHYPFFLYLIGRSGSGKGVLARFLSNMLPESSVRSGNSFDMISSAEKRHQSLTGVRLYTLPDMSGHHRNLGDYYEIIDNGRLSGRALYDTVGYETRWNVYFIICSVHPLQIENASEGWDRRAIPLPTKERTSKNDPYLEQKLKDVIPQVLSWALAMPKDERYSTLLEARNNPKVADKRREMDIISDSVKSFLDRCVIPDEDDKSTIKSSEFYPYYSAYCKQHGLSPVGFSVFSSRLKLALSKFFVDRKSVKREGKVTKIPAHWKNLKFLPGIFLNNEIMSVVTCQADFCQDGGLEELENFHKNLQDKSIGNVIPEPVTEPEDKIILINDMVLIPPDETGKTSESGETVARVVEIQKQEQTELIECLTKDGTIITVKNQDKDSLVILSEEILQEMKINPKTFGLPSISSWVEITVEDRFNQKSTKKIAFVDVVKDYSFLCKEHGSTHQKTQTKGWRKLSLEELKANHLSPGKNESIPDNITAHKW